VCTAVHTPDTNPCVQYEKKINEEGITPNAVYNMDEKGFTMGQTNIQHKIVPISLAIKGGGVQARMDGCRVSFIACVSASGMIMTPAVIFKGGSEQVGEN
jgi:hypothetical protein